MRFVAVCAASVLVLNACGARDATAPYDAATDASGAAVALGTTSGSGLTGTVSGLAGVCPALSFKLEGKVIKTTSATKFDGGACGDVKNGSRATIAGPAQGDGSIAAEKVTLLAATTTPPGGTTTSSGGTPATPAAGTSMSITGGIHALSGSCPAVTFTLEAKTIKTSAATRYVGGACVDIKNDGRATIAGTVQSDGAILAESVTILAATTTTGSGGAGTGGGTGTGGTATTPAPGTASTITGGVHNVSGACPTLTFTLEAKTIRTSSATTFSGGSCSDVKNDGRATVAGIVQTDGSILASSVTILASSSTTGSTGTGTGGTTTTTASTTVTVTGTISSLSGACPAVTFVLEGKTIRISAATTYERGSCAELRNAIRVTATGATQSDASVAATRVAFQP